MQQIDDFGYGADFGEYLESHETVSKDYHEWVYNQFRPYLGKSVLEVGAGIGEMTQFLLSDSQKVVAVEPSKICLDRLKKRFAGSKKLKFIDGTIHKLSKKDSFDSAIYVNVLEHIEADIQEMKDVKKFLKPKGKLLIFVPALETLYSPRDFKVGHYRRYYKKELERKLKLAGYKVDKLYYFDFIGSFLWYLKFTLLNSDKVNKTAVKGFNKIVVPFSKLIQFEFLPFGKNLVAVASKQESYGSNIKD